MIHAASRQALGELRSNLDAILGRFSTADGLSGLASELYQIAGLLVAQPQLRRRLADPTVKADQRGDLVQRLFEAKISASALAILRAAVALRWSTPWDLVDALETTADDVLLGAAEQAGVIDDVEDELFRFGRILDSDSRLATLLDDYAVDADRRVALLDSLVQGKVAPVTAELLGHAVTSERKRTVTHAIDDLLRLAARRRQRSMAQVVSAVELTAEQQRRLASALSNMYGRLITLRTAVEPTLRGGLVIRVGDEVIDGSIGARLLDVRTTLAG